MGPILRTRSHRHPGPSQARHAAGPLLGLLVVAGSLVAGCASPEGRTSKPREDILDLFTIGDEPEAAPRAQALAAETSGSAEAGSVQPEWSEPGSSEPGSSEPIMVAADESFDAPILIDILDAEPVESPMVSEPPIVSESPESPESPMISEPPMVVAQPAPIPRDITEIRPPEPPRAANVTPPVAPAASPPPPAPDSAVAVTPPAPAPRPGRAATPARPAETPRRAAPEPAAPRTPRRGPDLEATYVVGPEASRTMGYRIDWQSDAVPGSGTGLRSLSVQDDSIFAVDEGNFLVRLRRADGQRLWRLPVAEAVDQVQGITYMPNDQRVYLTMGGSILVLDAGNGSPVGRHRLDRTASTAPLAFGPYLIYGGRNGQLIWHLHDIAFPWRTYQVARSIDLRPLLVGNHVVAIGSDGTVMALQASTVAQLWSKKLLGKVVANPTAGHDVVYIAGTDQYIYAIEVHSGRTLWSKLTTSPLSDSPTLVGDSLYQYVPGEGLMCLDALAVDAPGGRVRWVSDAVRGTVLTQRGQRLLVWDARDRRMSIVDASRGSLVEAIALPQVTHLYATSSLEGELFAAADDGRVVRVVPRD